MSEKHVIKHSAAVQITNTISLLQRKAWNVLLANAYDRLPKQDFFEVDLNELIDVLGFDRRNRQYLKENLKTLMQCIVEWDVLDKDGDDVWAASVLLANVEIKKNTLRYSYSPLLKQRLYNPSTYARISLSMQNRFSSKYALALYELCVDFFIAKYKKGETPWIEIDDYKKLMDVGKDKIFKEFKHLNQRVIKDPIREINNKSDLYVEVQYRRHGRKISDIKFIILPNSNKNKLLDKLHRIDEATRQQDLPLDGLNNAAVLQQRLTEYGLSEQQAKEIVRLHDEPYILEVLDYVDIKIRADKIENISAFTYKAILEDYRPKKSLKEKLLADSKRIKAEIEIKAVEQEKLNGAAETDFSAYREKAVDDYLNSLDQIKRKELMDAFEKSLSGITKDFYFKDGLKSIMIKKTFIGFVSENYLKENIETFEKFYEQWLSRRDG